MMKTIFAAVLPLLFLIGSACAQDSLNVRQVAAIPTWEGVFDLDVQGDYVCVAAGGDGLRILDVSNPAHPQEISNSTSIMRRGVYCIALAGQYVYTVDSSGREIVTYDVSNPFVPQLIDTLQFENYYTGDWYPDMEMSGDFLYLMVGDLYIVDISEPTTPQLDASLDIWATEIAADFPYVCASVWDTLVIISVADSHDPIVVGRYVVSEGAAIRGIDLSNSLAYVSLADSTFCIIDFSDPSQPEEIAQLDLPRVPGWRESTTIEGDYAYVGCAEQTVIISIANPLDPQIVGSIPAGGGQIRLANDYAYFGSSGVSLRIADVSDPAQPELVGQFGAVVGAQYIELTDDDAVAYNGESYLAAIDISNPVIPYVRSKVSAWGFVSYVITLWQDYVYISVWNELKVWDISDPDHLSYVGAFPGERWFFEMASADGILFGANGASVMVYELSDEGIPTLVNTLELAAAGVATRDTLLFVAGDSLHILDRRDPLNLVELSSIRASGSYLVAGDSLVYAFSHSRISIFDISDPYAPILAGEISLLHYLEDVDEAGNYLVTCEYGHGIEVFDLTDPSVPSLTGYYEMPDWMTAVEARGHYAFIGGSSGFRVFDISDAMSVTDGRKSVPTETALYPAYPNPFNPQTTISFSLASNTEVKLRVFDILGRTVATIVSGRLAAGEHQVAFDGEGLASGVYIYRLEAGNSVQSRKMVLLR